MDRISDGLTKIRNASRAKHATVEVRFSRLMTEMLEVLKREGYIRTFKPVGETPADRSMRVYLKYSRRTPAISQLIRVSKPGERAYRKASELPRVLGGLGVAIVSTSKGLMTERDAYQQRIGGEVLCYVW
ncbi:MAG: 30S ribosomal protein S8 [Candidatus Omnitrophica bacterium CG11_big_fil_rev_8_21_14_0_20_63_9]|nr:MAG: 30S ribosomal protein S8 [Candidatus Omnitrophica bacterium CG11_big_fil_rev_8_21_14_0_20_63_9]